MKKIFTLLFAVGTISIASAQSRDFGHSKEISGYAVSGKQSVLQQINREYDYKIAAVKMNRYMNGWGKSKQIRKLENQRDAEISRARFRFEKDNHSFRDSKFAENNKHRW